MVTNSSIDFWDFLGFGCTPPPSPSSPTDDDSTLTENEIKKKYKKPIPNECGEVIDMNSECCKESELTTLTLKIDVPGTAPQGPECHEKFLEGTDAGHAWIEFGGNENVGFYPKTAPYTKGTYVDGSRGVYRDDKKHEYDLLSFTMYVQKH